MRERTDQVRKRERAEEGGRINEKERERKGEREKERMRASERASYAENKISFDIQADVSIVPTATHASARTPFFEENVSNKSI